MVDFDTRLTILSKREIDDLYGLPCFNEDEQAFYFALDAEEKKEMEALKSIESRLHFILQLGYFKAKSLFFDMSFSACINDINYIRQCYFVEHEVKQNSVSKNIRFDNNNRILKLLSYTLMNKVVHEKLDKQLLERVKTCVDPRFLFDDTLTYLNEQKIVLPGYSTLQKIISQILRIENKRLYRVIKQHITPSVDITFKELLTLEKIEKTDQKTVKNSRELKANKKKDISKDIYGITVLKKDAKSFRYKEMMKEVDKKKRSETIFHTAKGIIPKLDISTQNIAYYASMVDYYSVDSLKELSYETVRLYMLCYIYYRFEKLHDNIITMFFYHMNLYEKQGKTHVKEAVYQHKRETNDYDEKIADIIDVLVDDTISDLNVRPSAFQIVDKKEIPRLSQHLRNQLFDETKFLWGYYLSIAKITTKNLRPLVGAIDFESDDPNNALIKAVSFIKNTFPQKMSLKQQPSTSFPLDCIPASLHDYLYDVQEVEGQLHKVLNVYKYEFLVYYRLSKALDSERIFVNTSINFKSLKEDLYKNWEEDKEKLLATLNNPILNTPIDEQLATFKKDYTNGLVNVNQRIQKGENPSVRIKKEEKIIDEAGIVRRTFEWVLPYPKQEEEINSPFYDQLSPVSLNQVLRFVNERCGLIDEFTHIKSRYSKTKADEDSLYATITALATGHGIFQMAGLCDIAYTQLLGTFRNFIRLENLRKTNAKLVNKLAELPLFKQWNLLDNKLIFSVDGKKVFTRRNHCMARYSSKYFGQKRGVVLLSMIANNACPNALLISPHEYEGHSLYDVVYNDITELEADYVSGDTHSINHVNFALMHLIGCKFIPHIKNIYNQADKIYSFDSPETYNNYVIAPKKQFTEALIKDEWPNIQHIFVSLLMKHTTQHVIVRKLSSHHRSNKTLQALWEYNKILHDQHVLNVIDSPSLRRATRTALNRGEGYHQLTGKIMSINGNKLRGTTERELAISGECIRLIANCIIFYNTYLLSELYARYEKLGDKDALERIKKISPIAWRHINLGGRYEFTIILEALNVTEMLKNVMFNVHDKKKSFESA